MDVYNGGWRSFRIGGILSHDGAQPGDEQIRILLKYPRHSFNCGGRKSRRIDSSQASVDIERGASEGFFHSRLVRRECHHIELVLLAVGAKAVDFVPGAGIHEGQLIWSDANNWAISTVEFQDFVWKYTLEVSYHIRKAVSCPQFRTRVPAERVQVDVVYAIGYDCKCDLLLH